MEEEGRAVFVGSVSFDTEEKALREVLEDVGTLVSLDFPVHESGKNKGFAIAEFEDAATASRAIEKFNGFELDGRELYVRLDRKKGAPGKGSFRKRGSGRSPTRWRPTDAPPRAPLGTKGDGVSLFVGNLPWSATTDELKELFVPFGTIVSAQVVWDGKMQRSRGFGVVRFSSSVDAESAMKALDQTEFQGRRIYVKEDERSGKDAEV